MMLPLSAIATNIESWGDQTTLRHLYASCADECNVHDNPSFDDMIFGFVVEMSEETATNLASSGDQQTSLHNVVSSAEGRGVHEMPSYDTITRCAPEDATPTNIFRSGDQHMDEIVVDEIENCVQFAPSFDVAMRFVPATTNISR